MYESTTIVGNVGRDAEVRYTPSGVTVASFNVAVNRTWKDTNGEKQERTKWFRITCWRKLAEICAQYVKTGMRVLVEGEIDVSAWEKDGQPRASLELTANTVKFLSNKGEMGNGAETKTEPAAAYDNSSEIPF